MTKLDLHCHTYYSDGTTSPEFVVARAVENQVTHLAITDHDCVAPELIASGCFQQALDTSITLISGVEISCQWSSIEVHVVGLFVDHQEPTLKNLLARQQQARRSRVAEMEAKLDALDITGLQNFIDSLHCISVTRSHVANFLVSQGHAKNRQKAFKSYLAKGGKAYVASDWCSLEDCIKTINAAGGIAVLAHPGRYPLNKKKLALLVEQFAQAGGGALEVRYPNIAPDMSQLLERHAHANGLYFSQGSDFHDPQANWTDVGKLPFLSGAALEHAIDRHPIWCNSLLV